jgi:hypothetical protein
MQVIDGVIDIFADESMFQASLDRVEMLKDELNQR